MPKVLVVDDSLSVRKVVQRALESKRIEVLSAASGNEAMEQIAREAPDLIVCDVIMPDMDGYQICDFVKKHPTLGHTPVLLISGIVNSTVLERAAKVRSDDVMRKPFAADELLHRIESLLLAAGRPAAAAAPVPAPTASPAAPAPERRAPQPERPAPVAEPAVVVAPAPEPGPDLKALLAGVAELAGVSLTALIDREGALMEVAGGLLPEAELAGALAACLLESTDGVGRALTQGRLQSLILEYDSGVVLLNAVGAGAMLAVVLGDPAVLGKVRYHVKKALPDLVRAV
ncbi:MAG TPA: response regulator [Candidatus Acidoferrum sp.]|jgi:CheY-like chemotaxis protein/predicted regulator of Ras-like GTPase activity (Roadblock/LC7/MglB family)|nr:response regulator [Candidatus Acidoferrum sp.]